MKTTLSLLKKHVRTIVLLGVLALATGALYILLNQEVESRDSLQKYTMPDALWQRYVELLNGQQYEEMYEMLDEGSRETVAKDAFVKRHQAIYGEMGVVRIETTVRRVKEGDGASGDGQEDPYADIVVDYATTMQTMAGEVAFENQSAFCFKEGDGWRLRWSDKEIFPDLTATDEVVVTKTEAARGNIYDRNGMMLAGQGTASMIGLVPGKMAGRRKEDLQRMAELLGVTVESIGEALDASWVKEDTFVPIKRMAKVDELDLLAEVPDAEDVENDRIQKELLGVPGVQMVDEEVRTYPLGAVAAHLTGYVQNVTEEELKELGEGDYRSDSVIGRSGLEKAYEETLRGTDGCEIGIVGQDGGEKRLLAFQTEKDGADVTLTIDAELQKTLYNEFVEDRGCSVAMNPETGEVLAMVSTPSFDPNAFALGMSAEEWKSLSEDGDKPMWNRFGATWCPGSVFKPVMAAMGVTTGTLEPNRDYGREPGRKWQKDASWGGYFVTTLQAYDDARMENALIYSDNIYFAKAALRVGMAGFGEQMSRIGFGEAVPFDLGMTASTYAGEGGLASEIELADSGYGQGRILVNPLHVASLYSAFVNDGNMVAPYVKAGGQTTVWKEAAFSAEAAGLVRDSLVQVVENPDGTASGCRMDGVRLAGKTGTAEIKATQESKTGTEVGWLSIFTPERGTGNSVLFVSMVEDVKEIGGSPYVVKKEKKVLKWFFGQ